MRIGSVLKHSGQAVLEGALIALLVVGLMAGTAFAAKPAAGTSGHKGGGTTSGGVISAPVMVTDTGTPGLSAGDTITFSVSTAATTTPWVNLVCYQNGVLVYNGWKGFWVGSIDPTWNFGLASTAWQGGAADCTANLDMNTKQGMTQLSSTSFHVDS
jgi:hypothetical protein